MSGARLDLKRDVVVAGSTLDLSICIGEDWEQTFQLLDADGTTPTDITGWTFASEIRNKAGTLIATFTVSIVTAATGHFKMALAKAVTDLLTTNPAYEYDLFTINASSKYNKQLYGTVEVRKSVTDV